MKAWFVSDIHILDSDDPRLKRFEDFLRARLTDGTTHLFLVGDIFDLWVGSDTFFSARFSNAVQLIRDIKKQGIEVIYFEGNHDLHLQKFWSDELRCQVETAPKYYSLDNRRVRVEHGDQMNPNDTGYLFLRKFLRTAAVERLVKVLPGLIIQKIGNSMSRSSRKWTSSSFKARDDKSIREVIRVHAHTVHEKDLKDKPDSSEVFDLIISGHVHTRDDYSWHDSKTGKEVRSVNLGCWFTDEQPQAFLLENGAGRWVPV